MTEQIPEDRMTNVITFNSMEYTIALSHLKTMEMGLTKAPMFKDRTLVIEDVDDVLKYEKAQR